MYILYLNLNIVKNSIIYYKNINCKVLKIEDIQYDHFKNIIKHIINIYYLICKFYFK